MNPLQELINQTVVVLAQQPHVPLDRHREARQGGRMVGQIAAYVMVAVIVLWCIIKVYRRKENPTTSTGHKNDELQSVTLQCRRCRGEFDANDLGPPSLLLRLLAAPYFIMLSRQSSTLREETTAHYCRPCRRQLNVCFLFIAFLVVVFGTVQLVQYLGLN